MIPATLLLTISGARAISPEVLSPEVAYRLAYAYCSLLPKGPVVISRDSRPSGIHLKEAVLAALHDAGREVLDADLVPLPTTQLAVEHFRAAGAIDITASHNPVQYNGMKFLNDQGTFITQDIVDNIAAAYDSVEVPALFSRGDVRDIQSHASSLHVDTLIPMVEKGASYVVAVDAVNGAGSFIVPEFLEKLGCSVIGLAVDPSQPFPHTPEPIPANLEWTKAQLQNLTYDLAVVVDPDADRLVLIDELGRLIPEEATIPLVADALMRQGRKGSIVINYSTSRMVEDVAARYDCQVVRSAVGERNVITKMQKERAFFGGEGGGGIIDPQVHLGRDALVGIAHIISLLRMTGKKLSELVDALPSYAMEKVKVPVADSATLQALYARMRDRFPDAEANDEDGLQLSWADRWVHVRPSNTEPIVRVIAEAPSSEQVWALIEACSL